MFHKLKKKTGLVLRNNDYYGYPVQLGFNKSGNIHGTVIGGIFSMLSTGFFIAFAYSLYVQINNTKFDNIV